MAYHTLRQIWKNMILVKPKIVGDFSPQDIFRFIDKPSEMSDLYCDMFISLNVGNAGNNTNKLDILQGDLKIKEWFEGFQRIWDLILIGCGLSPQNEAQTVQTATEIVAKQQTSSETINLLKQLRVDQLYRLFDKVSIIERLWDGKGERPYTLSIAEEEKADKTLEIQEALAKITANLSNPIKEIAKLYEVSEEEAARIWEENKINSEDPNQSKLEKKDKNDK